MHLAQEETTEICSLEFFMYFFNQEKKKKMQTFAGKPMIGNVDRPFPEKITNVVNDQPLMSYFYNRAVVSEWLWISGWHCIL